MSIAILDIECVAQPEEEILKSLPEWSEEEARTRLPRNYRKQEAISGWLEEDKANWNKEALEKAALNPETATIAICGFLKNGKVEQLVRGNRNGVETGNTVQWFGSESELIEHAFLRLNEGTFTEPLTVLGWSLVGYDLRMLVRRAWILGVRVPKAIYDPLSRYSVPDRFVDLMERYGVKRGEKFSSLDSALKAMGLPPKSGSGDEFGKLWKEDRAKALEYNANDLLRTADVARRMGVEL